MKTLIVTLLFLQVQNVRAQYSTFFSSEKQIGLFSGIGRSDYSGIGTEYGLSFTRTNSMYDCWRMEIDMSCATYRSKSGYYRYSSKGDTVHRYFEKWTFIDLSVKTNLRLINRDRFHWYLVGGLTAGAIPDRKVKTNTYSGASKDLVAEGRYEHRYHPNVSVGFELGFLFDYKLSENTVVTLEPLLLSRASLELVGGTGPSRFDEVRIGIRKVF